MAKNILVGTTKNKWVRYDLEPLEAGAISGGQGDVYFPSGQNCIKIMHNPSSASAQLLNIQRILTSSAKLYDKTKSVSAVPMELVWDKNGSELIGYTMKTLLDGWHGMHEIQTIDDSKALGMNLTLVGFLLEDLCKAIRLIHDQGFVIGDLNPSNVLFQLDRTKSDGLFNIRIIDVDSWSIYRNDLGVEFASKVLDTNAIYHPDIIKADRENRPWPHFTPNHDWWAFACISWLLLTKYDPFVVGKIANCDREDRILEGDIADKAATVKLNPKFGPAAQALGPKLRLYLGRCLKRKVLRPFPTKVLGDFAREILKCNCGFTAHASAVICPKCAKLL